MKFIRTREHEHKTKKNLVQPTIPVALRKKLLETSKKHTEKEPEDGKEHAVGQVEIAAVQLTEQAVHTTAMVTQAVQPIIREKIVQAGIKERPTAAESIHHTQDEPTAAVPVEARQEIAAQKNVTAHEQPLQSAHYGQSKASVPKQDTVSTTVPPKEKPTGGASVPKIKARRPKATQSTPVAVKIIFQALR